MVSLAVKMIEYLLGTLIAPGSLKDSLCRACSAAYKNWLLYNGDVCMFKENIQVLCEIAFVLVCRFLVEAKMPLMKRAVIGEGAAPISSIWPEEQPRC